MTEAFTPEQTELRKILRRYCDAQFTDQKIRRVMSTPEGYETGPWSQMAQQLGLCSLAIPVEVGGAGFTRTEQAIACEELGRALAPVPFLSSVVISANLLLATKDTDVAPEMLAGIASGELRVAAAIVESAGELNEAAIHTTAEFRAGTWFLSGQKFNVVDGVTAHTLLVLARAREGVSIFALPAGTPGAVTTAVETLDLTRKQATLTLTDAPATLVGTVGGGWAAWSKTRPIISTAIAAECVGGALRVLELSADYARTRVQFGRPIGSNQAIKQELADLLVDVELARAATHSVARLAADSGTQFAIEAAMTHSLAAETYMSVAYGGIQIHGGIGFTWEHPLHLYFRRAKSNELLFGSPSYHREIAAQYLGLES